MTLPPFIVFTDLDGTLLDARTYSAEPARATLALLAARGAPVVFCSSKTAAEQRPLRAELGLEHVPFIVENGAAILVPAIAQLETAGWPSAPRTPDERMHVFGQTFAEVKAGIRRATALTGILAQGYAELSVPEIAALTGLDEVAAARARQRDFSETLVSDLPPASWATLTQALAAEGLSCRHGGRFRTVTGAETDKGRAVRFLTELFTRAHGQPVETIGIGDSANDEGLLLSVRRPYLIPKASGDWTPMEIPGLQRLARPGPHGWSDVFRDLLG